MNPLETNVNNFIRHIIDDDLVSGKYPYVHTRFPPEPNGYLHIGHAKSLCLNFGISNDYKGKCNLRIDDTNPVKENTEFIESIHNDVKWLGLHWNGKIRYSSHYFDQLYQYAIELISKGLAYVDELSPEQIRIARGTLTTPGKNSPYRDRSIEENLEIFEQMRKGTLEEYTACLRAKIDMASPFIVMRDPVLYRINFAKHHQTGDNWCIYPMYDFTHCISDSLEGITHSLCTLEFQNNRILYYWVLDNITISGYPHQYEFSRLNLDYTILSKRKLNILVKEKMVEGWDDPRMPTLSGLRRRGYTPASIRNFCNCIGVTKQESNVAIMTLESCIRDELNQSAPRVMAVLNPVKLIIDNMGYHIEVVTMPNHPNHPDMGNRAVPFSREIYIDRADFREEANKHYKRLVIGKEVRLRNAYIIKAERVKKDYKGIITIIYCSYDAETFRKNTSHFRKVPGVIHWVSSVYAQPSEIFLYEYLFIFAYPVMAEEFLSTINPKSLVIKQGFIEPIIIKAKAELSYQFEREGYFCADNRNFYSGSLVFNRTVKIRDTCEK